MIDLRSDTFTKPSPAMLEFMTSAEVGDDVFGEDPSVNHLEAMCAELFGMEAALFCPSGTMTNQIAIKNHTSPGNEVICDQSSHVYIYEGGGIAFNSGCQVKSLVGDRGRLTSQQVLGAINNEDIHKPRTKLVVLENTSNRGGGSCYQLSDIQEISAACIENNLKLHLDGARLFNALVKMRDSPKVYGYMFDSVSICLSKGLGAPVGSVLLGGAEFIREARRTRKVLGGGMRQAGYLAAAGIFALSNNVERLEQDHEHAKAIAETLLKKDFIGKMLPVETNILIFEVIGSYTPAVFCEFMKMNNIMCLAISEKQVRMVLHHDVVPSMVDQLIDLIGKM